MKEGALIRILIVALPAGLLLMGVASIFNSHFYKPEENLDPTEAIRLEAASLNRRPVSRDHLSASLQTLANRIGERHTGTPGSLESTAVWIESSLSGANLGYLVERQVYDAGGQEVRNLIAELPGRERRAEIIVVGAHYDTVPGSPGANGNGTGVAALLSLARAFAGDQQERTIRFVAFVNGAPPHFQTEAMGSLVHARACRSRQEKVVAMISLDSPGYFTDAADSQKIPEGMEGSFPTVGDFLAFVGSEDSLFFIDSAKSAFVRASRIPAIAVVLPSDPPGTGWSDDWSFRAVGFPAVVATDTASYRYPHHHRAEDAPDKIDLEKLEEVTRGIKSVIDVWANP